MKSKTVILYSALGLVAIASPLTVFVLPVESVLRELAGVPGVVALFSILLKILYDDLDHKRKILLQSQKEEFDVAITSHMANIAFDKHVEFCEEYLGVMNETITTLYRNGNCEEMLDYSSRLYQVKVKYRTWLTVEIESGLEPFEKSLRIIGANAHLYKCSPKDANETGAVKESHRILKEIFGYHSDGSAENEDIRKESVIRKVREIIGIEELTRLRYKKIGRRY